MNIRVTLNISLDPKLWDLAFATGENPEAVANDVRAYALTLLQNSAVLREEAEAVVTLIA